MALTGVYRQALQQVFSIQILDELFQGNVLNFENSNDGIFPEVHEVKNENDNKVEQIKTAQTSNIQNTHTEIVSTNEISTGTTEITEDYLENEFAGFFAEEEVA